ncbi:MAG: DUF4190 domain-containing protein [Myxococcales bacterium]|nr:DUF4190 domain-containing protein [Myxococcales bacterium]
MPTPAGASCPLHPGALAVDVCERCGRFVCGDCTVLRDERALCTGCAAAVSSPSSRATLALVCGALGFVCCVPFPLAAIALGRIEERAIDRGEAPREGLTRARWAVRLGAMQLALLSLLLVSFAAWRMLRERLTAAP